MHTSPPNDPIHSHSSGARQACRNILRDARTGGGRFIPLTVPEITAQLVVSGIAITQRDVEGFLRELEAAGEVVEIDASAGFRWT